jgi:hypothetical protein
MRRPRFRRNPQLRFEHYLCRELHAGTVGDMRRRMSGAEFARWVAFYRVEQREREKAERDAKRKRGRR